jgi:hypothetical protein
MFTEPLPINGHIPACYHGNVLASRWLAMDYSGFQASYHSIVLFAVPVSMLQINVPLKEE